MIFDEKYNNAINLLCKLNTDFENDFNMALKLLPQRLTKKCKSKKYFEYFDDDLLANFDIQNGQMEFTVKGDDFFIDFGVNPLSEKIIERMEEFDMIESLFFTLDIEDKSVMYDLEIRRVRNNRFVISVRKNNEYDESEETYYEIGKNAVLENLKNSHKR